MPSAPHPALAAHHAKVAVFNLKRLVGFINSVAYARAAAMSTSVQVQAFSQNAVMNAVMQACTSEPGIMEATQDTLAVTHHCKLFAKRYLHEALDRAAAGTAEFLGYLDHLEKMKEQNLALVRQTFQQAVATDNEIIDKLTNAIHVLAGVKVAATIAIAVTPVGLTMMGAEAALISTAGGVAFVYSVTKGVVKNIGEGKDAKVIAFDAGKEAGKEAVNRGADKLKEHAAEKLGEHADLIAEAEKKIDELTATLARKVSSRKIAKLNRQIGRAEEGLADAQKLAGKTKLMGTMSKGVPVVFAAMDIWEAIEDYRKEMGYAKAE